MKKQLRYKFLQSELKSQSKGLQWKIGEWKKTIGELKMCENGFHCSVEPLQALSYVKGEVVSIVEVRGESIIHDDKEVWEEMKIVKAYKWEKKDSVALSIFAAEQVINIFENKYPNDNRPRKAIEEAKKWLADPASAAAYAASASAASASASASAYASASASAYAAYAAAYAASYAASAASAAAYAASAAAAADAASASASAASKEKFYKKLHKWMRDYIKNLEEIKK